MLSSSSLLLLGTLITILVTGWIQRRRQRHRFLQKYGIHGPDPNFFFGNILSLMNKNVATVNDWVKRYGAVFSVVDIGTAVYISDPEIARQIQVKDFSLFPQRRTMFQEGGFDADPYHEKSVVATDISSQRWREQRALITSAFTSSKIKLSVPQVNEGIDILMENIQKEEKSADFNIYDLIQRLTMDTIGRSAFGTNLNVQRNPDNKFFVATKRVFDNLTKSWTMQLTFLTMLFPEFFHVFYPIRKLQRVILKWIGMPTHFTYQLQMVDGIVKQRKLQNARGEKKPDDLLQRFIDASMTSDQIRGVIESGLEANADHDKEDDGVNHSHRKQGKDYRMSDQEVAANASVMFDAGFETTATFLGFLMHVLVNRQDIQDEVRREVMQLKDEAGVLDSNTIHTLPYLTSVMFETLRFFPPVTFFVTRQSTVEHKIKNITIPADTPVIFTTNAMHFNPKYWDQPNEFDPLRFYGENKSRAQSPAFQAFGAGPRNCLGMRFALMEAKLAVARILSEYKLVPGPRTEAFDGLQIEYKPVTQNPLNGVFVKAVRI